MGEENHIFIHNIGDAIAESEKRIEELRQTLVVHKARSSSDVAAIQSEFAEGVELIAAASTEADTLLGEIERTSTNPNPVLSCLESKLVRLSLLRSARSYVDELARVARLADTVQHSESEAEVLLDAFSQIIAAAEGASGKHLRTAIIETLHSLTQTLTQRLTRGLHDKLVTVGWPKPVSLPALPHTVDNADEALASIRAAAHHLVRLQLLHEQTCDLADRHSLTSTASDTHAVSIGDGTGATLFVVRAFLEPVVSRFAYHFMNAASQTNRIDKPEWCFTHALKLMDQHAPFISHVIQPLLDTAGVLHPTAEFDFARGIALFVRRRVAADCTALANLDPGFFAHTMNEALEFDTAIHRAYGEGQAGDPALTRTPSCVEVMATSESTQGMWLRLELSTAKATISSLSPLKDMSAWAQDTSRQEEDLPLTKVATAVTDAVQGFVERLSFIESQSVKDKFLANVLQTFVSDTVETMRSVWLRRICRVSDRAGSHSLLGAVVNTAAAIERHISQIAMLPDLQVQVCPNEKDSEGDGDEDGEEGDLHTHPVLSSLASELRELSDDMVADATEAVCNDFRLQCADYYTRRELWSRESAQEGPLEISPLLCPALDSLRQHLTALHTAVAPNKFASLWLSLSNLLSDFLLDKLLRRHSFTASGAMQVRYDMEAVFVLFSPFTRRPRAFFRAVDEYCRVLTLPDQDLHMLIKALQSQHSTVPAGEGRGHAPVLEEVLCVLGIEQLSVEEVGKVATGNCLRGMAIAQQISSSDIL